MSKTKTLLGFAAGAAIGALAGILLAPEKGSDTRKKISNKTSDLADAVKNSFGEYIEHMEEEAKSKINTMKADLKNKMDRSLS